MTVDEKITRLQESAMQEARSKGNAIVEQHKKALTHVFEQHKAEALIQADTRIKAEKTSVKQQLGMANSKAALELKRELGAAQKRLKKQLFKEVEEKLSAYMKTEKYQDLLVKYIDEVFFIRSVQKAVCEADLFLNNSEITAIQVIRCNSGNRPATQAAFPSALNQQSAQPDTASTAEYRTEPIKLHIP